MPKRSSRTSLKGTATARKALSDPKNVQDLKRRIDIVYSRKFGGKVGTLEDCIGFVFQQFMTNPRQTIDQAVIDYARTQVRLPRATGKNKNRIKDRIKAKAKFYFATEFDPKIHTRIDPTDPDHQYAMKEVVASLTDTIDRACFVLYWKWGLTFDEIAEALGYSTAGIGLRFKALNEQIFLSDIRPN